MIPENFVYLAAIASFIGGFGYIKDTLSGKAKPNRVTWLLWAIVPFIAFIAEIQQGVGLASLMTFMAGLVPLLIFLASFFNKKSVWKLGMFDFICGAFSVVGVILWLATKDPNLAIVFSILADFLAALPTISKSFYHPKSESISAFLGGLIGAVLTILTLTNYDLAHIGFPFYILVLNTVIVSLVRFNLVRILKK